MTKRTWYNHPALQIFFACLIPNLGGWIMFVVLGDRIEEAENADKVRSFLELPTWVRTRLYCFNNEKIYDDNDDSLER